MLLCLEGRRLGRSLRAVPHWTRWYVYHLHFSLGPSGYTLAMKHIRLKAFKKISQFHFVVSLSKMFVKIILPREPGSYCLLDYVLNRSCPSSRHASSGSRVHCLWFLGLSHLSFPNTCSMWQFGHHTGLGEEPIVIATGLSLMSVPPHHRGLPPDLSLRKWDHRGTWRFSSWWVAGAGFSAFLTIFNQPLPCLFQLFLFLSFYLEKLSSTFLSFLLDTNCIIVSYL